MSLVPKRQDERPALIEALEPRLLLSADGLGGIEPTALDDERLEDEENAVP